MHNGPSVRCEYLGQLEVIPLHQYWKHLSQLRKMVSSLLLDHDRASNSFLDQFLKSIFILISLKVIYTLSLHWPLWLHFLLTPRSIKNLLCDYLQEPWLLATCSDACLCWSLFLSHHSLTNNLLVLKWITDFWWESLFAPAAHAQSFTGFCWFKLFFIEIVNQYLPEIMVWSLKGDLVSLLQYTVTKPYTHQVK